MKIRERDPQRVPMSGSRRHPRYTLVALLVILSILVPFDVSAQEPGATPVVAAPTPPPAGAPAIPTPPTDDPAPPENGEPAVPEQDDPAPAVDPTPPDGQTPADSPPVEESTPGGEPPAGESAPETPATPPTDAPDESPADTPDAGTPGAETPVPGTPESTPDVEAPEPAIACESGGATNTFACAIDPGASNATVASLALSGPAGWAYAVNDAAADATGSVDLVAAGVDITAPGNVLIAASFPAGCPDVAGNPRVHAVLTYTYDGDDTASAETSLALAGTESMLVPPSLAVSPIDFGDLTWDGSSWGASDQTATISIARDGCGDAGAFAIEFQVIGADPGLRPMITAVAASGDGVASITTAGNPNDGPVAVAQVASGFHGNGQVEVSLTLAPEGDAPAGSHAMQVRVSTSHAP